MNRRTFLATAVFASAPALGGEGDSILPPNAFRFGPKEPPKCETPDKCRFQAGMSTTTLLGVMPPVYDRDGRVIGERKDPNRTTTQWSCLTCGKTWSETV